jgi:hypothetical protein
MTRSGSPSFEQNLAQCISQHFRDVLDQLHEVETMQDSETGEGCAEGLAGRVASGCVGQTPAAAFVCGAYRLHSQEKVGHKQAHEWLGVLRNAGHDQDQNRGGLAPVENLLGVPQAQRGHRRPGSQAVPLPLLPWEGHQPWFGVSVVWACACTPGRANSTA